MDIQHWLDQEVHHYQHFHEAVAGMMYVNDEDLDTVAAARRVECSGCDLVYRPGTGWVES